MLAPGLPLLVKPHLHLLEHLGCYYFNNNKTNNYYNNDYNYLGRVSHDQLHTVPGGLQKLNCLLMRLPLNTENSQESEQAVVFCAPTA